MIKRIDVVKLSKSKKPGRLGIIKMVPTHATGLVDNPLVFELSDYTGSIVHPETEYLEERYKEKDRNKIVEAVRVARRYQIDFAMLPNGMDDDGYPALLETCTNAINKSI